MSNVKMQLSGRIHWQLINTDGSIAMEGAQSNLILDSGLNALALVSDTQLTSFRQYLGLGTNGTLPNVAQTDLLAAVETRSPSDGGFGAEATNSYVAIPGSNVWRGEFTVVKTVTLTANRNIAEFALFASNVGGLASIREVPRDGNGDPIVVSALSGQIFKLNHTLRVDIPYNSVARNFTIIGAGVQSGTECFFHDNVANQGLISDIFTIITPASGMMVKPLTNASSLTPTTNPIYVFGDTINANGAPIPYVINSFKRTKRVVIAPSAMVGNHGGWAIVFGQISNGRNAGYKFVLTSGNYVKTNLKQLTLDFTVSWARAP
jgi:hypothetical protein